MSLSPTDSLTSSSDLTALLDCTDPKFAGSLTGASISEDSNYTSFPTQKHKSTVLAVFALCSMVLALCYGAGLAHLAQDDYQAGSNFRLEKNVYSSSPKDLSRLTFMSPSGLRLKVENTSSAEYVDNVEGTTATCNHEEDIYDKTVRQISGVIEVFNADLGRASNDLLFLKYKYNIIGTYESGDGMDRMILYLRVSGETPMYVADITLSFADLDQHVDNKSIDIISNTADVFESLGMNAFLRSVTMQLIPQVGVFKGATLKAEIANPVSAWMMGNSFQCEIYLKNGLQDDRIISLQGYNTSFSNFLQQRFPTQDELPSFTEDASVAVDLQMSKERFFKNQELFYREGDFRQVAFFAKSTPKNVALAIELYNKTLRSKLSTLALVRALFADCKQKVAKSLQIFSTRINEDDVYVRVLLEFEANFNRIEETQIAGKNELMQRTGYVVYLIKTTFKNIVDSIRGKNRNVHLISVSRKVSEICERYASSSDTVSFMNEIYVIISQEKASLNRWAGSTPEERAAKRIQKSEDIRNKVRSFFEAIVKVLGSIKNTSEGHALGGHLRTALTLPQNNASHILAVVQDGKVLKLERKLDEFYAALEEDRLQFEDQTDWLLRSESQAPRV